MTLMELGIGAFLAGGAISIGFIVLLEWRERTAAVRGLLFIGFSASSLLSLVGLVAGIYDLGMPLPLLSRLDRRSSLLTGLALFAGLYFASRRGLSAKLAALACGYTVLVVSGLIPNPARSQGPWPAVALLVAISWRLIRRRRA